MGLREEIKGNERKYFDHVVATVHGSDVALAVFGVESVGKAMSPEATPAIIVFAFTVVVCPYRVLIFHSYTIAGPNACEIGSKK